MSLAAVYQCFSHHDRLRIVAMLAARALCVQELQAVLRLSQVEVSKHLRALRQSGFVVSAKSGTFRIYQVRSELPFDLAQHLACLRKCIEHGRLLQQEFERLKALPVKPGKKSSTRRLRSEPRPMTRHEVLRNEVPAPVGTDLVLEDHLL